MAELVGHNTLEGVAALQEDHFRIANLKQMMIEELLVRRLFKGITEAIPNVFDSVVLFPEFRQRSFQRRSVHDAARIDLAEVRVRVKRLKGAADLRMTLEYVA